LSTVASDQIGVTAAERILEAAFELFAQAGYDAVSINDIAARAAVSKANVFHHFRSKQALYEATLDEACRRSSEQVETLMDAGGSFAERLRTLMVSDLKHMCDKQERIRLVLREILDDGHSSSHSLAGQVFRHKFRKLAAFFRLGREAGEFRKDLNPRLAALQVMAANIFFIQMREVLRQIDGVHYGDVPERYAQRMSAVLLRGFAAHPSASSVPSKRPKRRPK
jgi:TetR/AcrR family transcriptional regulator